MIDRLAELPSRVIQSPQVRAAAFATVLALEIVCATPVRAQGINESETSATSLRLENWQKGALRLGLAGLLTGGYALRLGSTLRQNEGSNKRQKRWNNVGLAVQGAGTALIDSVILTAPF